MGKIWDIKIPTLLALLFLIGSIGITSLLIQSGITPFISASVDKTPQDIRVTNITDTSLSISFITKEKTQAFVQYGLTEDFDEVAYDIRDSSKSLASYESHLITINKLKPNTMYFYSIVIDGKQLSDKGKSYSITTAPTLTTPINNAIKINGKAIETNGNPSSDTLVIFSTTNSQTLSFLTSNTGNFTFEITELRSRDLKETIKPNAKDIATLTLYKNSQTTTVTTFISLLTSIPLLTISKQYDFTDVVTNTKQSDTTSLLKPIPIPNNSHQLTITLPQKDASFTDVKPLFRGTAQPASKVTITVRSNNPITTQVVTDKNGAWSFRPNSSLAPGDHTITIESIDASGILKRITQSFKVYAQGSQVSESATPSATLTPTTEIVPSQAPTLTTTPIPTIQPSITVIQPTPLNAGEINNTITVTIAAFSIIAIGTVLIFAL